MRVLSFDLEDWFHLLDHPGTKGEEQWTRYPARIEANLERILDLLEETSSEASFFCLGWVAEKYPRLIRKIADRSYHIGTHSHLHQLVYEQSRDQFRSDLRRSIAAISDVTGTAIDTYRAPGFSIRQDSVWAFEILAEEGIRIDSSVFPASRAHGGLRTFESHGPFVIDTAAGKIRELPMNTASFAGKRMVFSGGGYFRLLPYPVLRRLFRQQDYVMTYFHPRDFDPDQPVIDGLSPARKFKSYVGLRGSEKKLRSLLEEFRFTDVLSAVAKTSWDDVVHVSV